MRRKTTIKIVFRGKLSIVKKNFITDTGYACINNPLLYIAVATRNERISIAVRTTVYLYMCLA